MAGGVEIPTGSIADIALKHRDAIEIAAAIMTLGALGAEQEGMDAAHEMTASAAALLTDLLATATGEDYFKTAIRVTNRMAELRSTTTAPLQA